MLRLLYRMLLYLVIFDQVSHEVLDDVSLTLFEEDLVEEFGHSQALHYGLNVLLIVEFLTGALELLIRDPLLAIVGPPTQEHIPTATATLARERHQPVAEISEPKTAAIVDTLDHFIGVVSWLSLCIFGLVLLFVLEVHFLEHAFVKDKGLVVADKEGEEAGDNGRVTTKVR